MPAPLFTPAQVAEIRRQKADGLLKTGEWARALGCSRETIARVARGDSYNQTVLVEEPPSVSPEDDAAALASLARFRKAAADVAPQAPQINDLLNELSARKPGTKGA
jgi:hypothetical protein